jgi:hypothetical protein
MDLERETERVCIKVGSRVPGGKSGVFAGFRGCVREIDCFRDWDRAGL